MKKILMSLAILSTMFSPLSVNAIKSDSNYTMVIEGEDWGPSVTKLVISNDESTQLNVDDYLITVVKSAEVENEIIVLEEAEVMISDMYYSDDQGNKIENEGNFITLEIEKGPEITATSPFHFDFEMFANFYVDLAFTIQNTKTNQVWDQEGNVITKIVDEFEFSQYEYTDKKFGDMTLSYASYSPEKDNQKNPLIIWLHGMGEGGNDPRLVLLGNKVTSLADETIQGYFNGAYVLAPQSPTFWMDHGDGNMTIDGSSMYSNALFSLIEDYVSSHDDIDLERIYIGGCSNGGFMTMRMLMDHPTYFAAAYPICEAMYNDYVSDTNIQQIKHIPMWFTHAYQDMLAEVDYITIPTYGRLLEAGAENVHFSLYENVVDPSGNYFNEDGSAYEYNAHFSWIYTLNDDPNFDFEGEPVLVNGKEATIFQWLANQTKQPSQYVAPTFFDIYGSILASFIIVGGIVACVIFVGKRKEEENK